MRFKAIFGLLMISLVLIQAQTGYFGEIGFNFQTVDGADADTHSSYGQLTNFVYSLAVEGRPIMKVWDMTMSSNGAMFLAQDAYLNCYIGSMNLSSSGAVALQKIEENCIISLLITNPGNVFVWFQDGSAGLFSNDSYSNSFETVWLIAPPSWEFDSDSTSNVTLLSDWRDGLWVFGNGFIASYSADGFPQHFKRQNFTIEGYNDYEIQGASILSMDSFFLIATAGDGASATSLIIIITTADMDWTVRASVIEGNVAFNDLNLNNETFTTTGSYTENGQTYFLSTSVDTKSLEISTASRSEQPIDGPLSGKTYHLYGEGVDDVDDFETWAVLETYSLAGNTLIYQRGSTLTQRTISSTGCYTFIPTNLAGSGSPEHTVLIGGYLSDSDDGPLMFMSWDTDSSLEGVFTVGNEESLSTIGINLESVTAEVTTSSSGSLVAISARIMVTNIVLSPANNTMSPVEIITPLPQYNPMSAVTFDDGTFNYPLSDLTITVQDSVDVEYNTDTHEMALSSEATGVVTVQYSVTYKDTYVCMSSSVGLSNVASETYVLFANEASYDSSVILVTPVSVSSGATATFSFITGSESVYIFTQGVTVDQSPTMVTSIIGGVYDFIAIPDSTEDYLFVTEEILSRVRLSDPMNSWSIEFPTSQDMTVKIPSGQTEYAFVYVLENGAINIMEVTLETGLIGTNSRKVYASISMLFDITQTGQFHTLVYKPEEDSNFYIMSVNLETEEVDFNKSLTLGEEINKVMVFPQNGGYVVTGSSGSNIGFIIQLDGTGEIVDAEYFITSSPLISSFNLGYSVTNPYMTTTGTFNAEKSEAILTLNTEEGIYTYIFLVKDITMSDDDLILSENSENIILVDVSKMGAPAGVTCIAYSLDVSPYDSYLVGGGVCAATFDMQTYFSETEVKVTPFFFKLNSHGQFDQVHDTSDVLFYSLPESLALMSQLSVVMTSSLNASFVKDTYVQHIGNNYDPEVMEEAFYVSPNLVGVTTPAIEELDNAIGIAGSSFEYEVSSDFFGSNSLNDCSWEISSRDEIDVNNPVQVDWDIVSTLGKFSGNIVQTLTGDVLPSMEGEVWVPLVAQCYGFFQQNTSFELQIVSGDMDANHESHSGEDDQDSSSESDDADVDANHSDEDEDQDDQDSSESDDADVDVNHSDDHDDEDDQDSSESDDADVDANHSDDDEEDQDSSESDDADVDVSHSDDDDDRDSSESGDADIDANHSDEDDDDQDSSESDDADVDANHESHSDEEDQDSSSESDSSSGDSSSSDKPPVHPSGAPGTGHESASSAVSLNGFLAAFFVALVTAL